MTIEDEIRARIATVPEPCAIAFGATTTIDEMGLIDDVTFADGHAVVTLCLTDAACVHFAAMQRFIADALEELPAIERVTVRQSLDRLWTPDRMAAA